MHEFVTRGLVLGKEPSGEYDARYDIFTERFGKLKARSRSVRKPTSKLAGHFEPGNIVNARFVEAKGLQMVDGLKLQAVAWTPPDLDMLDRLLPEAVPEPAIWQMMSAQVVPWARLLAILGFDATHATCGECRRTQPTWFHPERQEFFCDTCASRFGADTVLLRY